MPDTLNLAMPMVAHLASRMAEVSPVDSATGSVVGYLLGFGPLGIFALALAWLLFKGWRLMPPGREDAIRQSAREDGRADLTAELARANTRADKAEAKYDAVVEQLQPLLSSFVTVTGTLNPILQDLVRYGLTPAGNRRREVD